MRNVLSIQSWVAYGHVGNASAVFPMQRLGVEVWAIHTVMFSNHTGYGAWRGPVFAVDQVRANATACSRAIWATQGSAKRSSMRPRASKPPIPRRFIAAIR
jgi:pyridoxal/pyridoxine/pyridoxamine kinase